MVTNLPGKILEPFVIFEFAVCVLQHINVCSHFKVVLCERKALYSNSFDNKYNSPSTCKSVIEFGRSICGVVCFVVYLNITVVFYH